ncbi:hypothetical protein D3C81_2034540 [compost metagenome]
MKAPDLNNFVFESVVHMHKSHVVEHYSNLQRALDLVALGPLTVAHQYVNRYGQVMAPIYDFDSA